MLLARLLLAEKLRGTSERLPGYPVVDEAALLQGRLHSLLVREQLEDAERERRGVRAGASRGAQEGGGTSRGPSQRGNMNGDGDSCS